MRANVGDWIRIMGHHTGVADRRGQVMVVHGPDGEPPYDVHWLDNDHESFFFPGSDAVLDEPHAPGAPHPTHA